MIRVTTISGAHTPPVVLTWRSERCSSLTRLGGIPDRRNFPPNAVGAVFCCYRDLMPWGSSLSRQAAPARTSQRVRKGGIPMEWVQPGFEEISLACEINSYAVATL